MTVSLVTGTSTGIGFATALRLAQGGHRVKASVRSRASGEALLTAGEGLDLDLVVMEVDDDDSVADAIAGVIAETAGIDVLVNNAGIAGGESIEETDLADFRRLMNTNAWGVLRCIQAVLPSMRERGSGRIVNVTSLAGRVALPGQGAYAMSKWATEALTEVVAAEAAPFGIRVSAIEPGIIVTPIFEKGMEHPPDPDSPYAGGRRLGEVFLNSLMAGATAPEVVADTIWEAVNADEPALRYLVGDDAERLQEYRSGVTDEAWVALNAEPDDAAWRSWMAEVTGIVLPDP